jgi:DNA-binding transcriptional MerR regulator
MFSILDKELGQLFVDSLPFFKFLWYFLLTMPLLVYRIGVMKNNNKVFNLDEICALVEMGRRKVRYYIQKNLVDKPEGTGKGAYYTHRHLEQLLAIRKWKDAGVSLERIKEIFNDEKGISQNGKPLPPPRIKKEGSVEVWSHLHISDGIELHIEPKRSGLSPDQVRALFREVMKQYEIIKAEED